MTTDNRTNEPTEARISDADLSDEHLPNRAYKVGRKIAERGDFNGLDAATVFMRGAVYGVRKLAAPQPLDPEKVAAHDAGVAARAKIEALDWAAEHLSDGQKYEDVAALNSWEAVTVCAGVIRARAAEYRKAVQS